MKMIKDNNEKISELEALVGVLKQKSMIYNDLKKIAEESKKNGYQTLVFAKDAAKILECSEAYLNSRRFRRLKPIFYKEAGKIKYDVSDLLDYINECKKLPI